jgi:hypothetical protein
MSAHYFSGSGFKGVIHLADIYHFEGYTFEWHHYCGPFLCRKNMEPCKRQPGTRSKFWKALARWEKLPISEKEKTRIYG